MIIINTTNERKEKIMVIYIIKSFNFYTGENEVVAEFGSKADACFYIDTAERKNKNNSYSLEVSLT